MEPQLCQMAIIENDILSNSNSVFRMVMPNGFMPNESESFVIKDIQHNKWHKFELCENEIIWHNRHLAYYVYSKQSFGIMNV